MLYSIDQLKQFSANLVDQIKQSDRGEKTDLAYSINDLPPQNLIEENEIFQVIMIGGSHVESALVKFEEGELKISSFFDEDMGLLSSREIVLNIFEKNLDPKVSVIALNFAYPLKPIIRDGMLDGILLSGTKQHTFDGFVGATVGLEIENHIYKKLGRKIKVTLCNDTVALGLASIGYKENFDHSNSFFAVVGTGFNFGLFRNEHQLVNLESGNFSGFEQSHTGKIIDSLSTNYRKQKLEKEVGGAYLCNHFNVLACLEGLEENVHSTKEISHIAEQGNTPAAKLALKVYEHSASLVAMHIYALFKHKAEEAKVSPEEFKSLVIVEGSLFWKGYGYKDLVEKYFSLLGLKKDQIEIAHFDKIGVKGAAKLARIKN